MTDRELLVSTLEKLGINEDKSRTTWVDPDRYQYDEEDVKLGDGGGTPGCYTLFHFDENGKFTGHSVWD